MKSTDDDNLQSYLVVRQVQVSLEGMWGDNVHMLLCSAPGTKMYHIYGNLTNSTH
jgi:hypothetical protein